MSDFVGYAEKRTEYYNRLEKYVDHADEFTDFKSDIDLLAAPKLINKFAAYADQVMFLQMISEELYGEHRMLNEAYRTSDNYLKEWQEELVAERKRIEEWSVMYAAMKARFVDGSMEEIVRNQNEFDIGDPLIELKNYNPTERV